MKLFLPIALLLSAQVADVAALCRRNSDCFCSAGDFCANADGAGDPTAGPCGGSDARCYCDESTPGELNRCRYSRNPPPDEPTPAPTSAAPTYAPTTASPTYGPTYAPTASASPTAAPTTGPTTGPTAGPSGRPSDDPSATPTTAAPTGSVGAPPAPGPGGGDCPPAAQCPVPERECGWGIWNVWTCQCDCAPGFCLSANQECYDGCTTRTDFNPFGGCAPGCDCPWYPDPAGGTRCVSTVNFAGIYNIHRTAEQCCQKHFSYLDTGGCVAESEGTIETAIDETADREARPSYFYPDLFGRDNCIYHNGYYDWMMGAHSESYLFATEDECCSAFYPARDNCPDLSPSTERSVNERPYPVKPYFYPHQTESNCRFGRNYPQWMAQEQYVQDHLYTTPEECCDVWYPGAGDCPLGPDDGVQEGRYWQSDVYFYPSWTGDFCNVGNSYPEWMADPTNNDDHLFDDAASCCARWFGDLNSTQCEMNVVAVYSPVPVDEVEPEEWYPTLAWPHECRGDGNAPSWMTNPGFKQYYVFESQAACCDAFYCASTWTHEPTAGPSVSSAPSSVPSTVPSLAPTTAPSAMPSVAPTVAPSSAPSPASSSAPSSAPTAAPSSAPSALTSAPIVAMDSAMNPAPTSAPTSAPTTKPTPFPTAPPTKKPTASPTTAPTSKPTFTPTSKPTEPELEEWYPTLSWPYACRNDGDVPSWMTNPGFKQYYVFESQAACCSAHYCASAPNLFG